MTDIVWADPPARKRTPWVTRLLPLIERPGSWARIHTMGTEGSAQATVSTLRSGKLMRPTGAWEFRSDGADVYARYMGPVNGYPMGEAN